MQGGGHQRWQKGAHLCRSEPTAGQALPVTLLPVFRGAGESRRPQVLCCLPQNPFHCSAVTRNSWLPSGAWHPAWTGLHGLAVERGEVDALTGASLATEMRAGSRPEALCVLMCAGTCVHMLSVQTGVSSSPCMYVFVYSQVFCVQVSLCVHACGTSFCYRGTSGYPVEVASSNKTWGLLSE